MSGLPDMLSGTAEIIFAITEFDNSVLREPWQFQTSPSNISEMHRIMSTHLYSILSNF